MPYSRILGYGLSFIADIADNGMDLSTVSGVNWWKFAGQPFLCHAASGKDKSGISIWKEQSESQRYFDNLPGLEHTVVGHIHIGTGIIFMYAERIVSGSQTKINEFYFHTASPL